MVDALVIVVEDAVMVDVIDSGTSNMFTSSMLATSLGVCERHFFAGFARDTANRIFVMMLVGVKSEIVS